MNSTNKTIVTPEVSSKYGMRKILMENFDPNRYVLRIGFPDFPLCPYGNNFRALGYDVINQEYVRLAASIMKSDQMKKIKYNKNI